MSVTRPTLRSFAFRATHPDYRDFARTAAMSRRYPMRFNTVLVGAVYISDDPQTAIEELRRRAMLAGRSLPSFSPRSMFVVGVTLNRVLDLVDAGVRDAWGLTEDDLTSDDYQRCQEVAEAAAVGTFEAIRWPSATGSGNSLAVFFDHLESRSALRVLAEYDLNLEALERRMPVLDLVPDLRRWL